VCIFNQGKDKSKLETRELERNKILEVELYITCIFSRMAPAETWIFFHQKRRRRKQPEYLS